MALFYQCLVLGFAIQKENSLYLHDKSLLPLAMLLVLNRLLTDCSFHGFFSMLDDPIALYQGIRR
jgi:hypothetical protein